MKIVEAQSSLEAEVTNEGLLRSRTCTAANRFTKEAEAQSRINFLLRKRMEDFDSRWRACPAKTWAMYEK